MRSLWATPERNCGGVGSSVSAACSRVPSQLAVRGARADSRARLVGRLDEYVFRFSRRRNPDGCLPIQRDDNGNHRPGQRRSATKVRRAENNCGIRGGEKGQDREDLEGPRVVPLPRSPTRDLGVADEVERADQPDHVVVVRLVVQTSERRRILRTCIGERREGNESTEQEEGD
jgi:hypothetical protein